MSLDIIKLEESWLKADIGFDEWLQEYELNFSKPALELVLAMSFQQAPQEVKDQLKRDDPAGYEQLERRFGGDNGNTPFTR